MITRQASSAIWRTALGALTCAALIFPGSATTGQERGRRDNGNGPGPRRDSPPQRDRGREAPPTRREESRPPTRTQDRERGREAPPPERRVDPPTRREESRPPARTLDRERGPRDSTPTRDRGVFDRGPRDDEKSRVRGQESNGRSRQDVGGRRTNENPPPVRDNGNRGIFDRGRDTGTATGRARNDTTRPTTSPRDRGPTRDGGPAALGWDPAPRRDRALDIFTRSREGRTYRHGISLRRGGPVRHTTLINFFPHRYAYYPYYAPSFVSVDVCWSPFRFYFGVCPPYIYRRHVTYHRPRVVYIEVPIYVDSAWRGYRGWGDDDYYLVRYDTRTDWQRDYALRRAVEGLEDAFDYADIGALVDLTDPSVSIAVFQQGQYEYTMAAGDYLDITRDFLRTSDTIDFDVYSARRRADGVYGAYARHAYRDRDGDRRTVYLCYVFERVRGRWIISQVDTSPERLGN